MSYKFVTGSIRRGDIYFEDDRTGAQTYIDFGQDTITLRPSGSAILYTEAGKVGIGTSIPTQMLHISASSGNAAIRVQAADGYGGINIKGGENQSAWVWQPEDTDNLRFEVGSTDRIHIDGGTGNVGIGTNSPDSTLHVAGTTHLSNSAGTEVLRIAKADGDTREIVLENDGADAASIYLNSAEHLFIRQENASKDLCLRVAATNAIRIDGSTSRVGIFTDTPTEVLDIAGDAIRLRTSQTPPSSVGANGDNQGMIAWDVNYIYICTANWDGVANIWKRVSIGDTW